MSEPDVKPTKPKYIPNPPKLNSKGQGTAFPKLNPYQRSELYMKIIKWRLEGKSRSLILEMIPDNCPVELTKDNCISQYVLASQFLEEITEMEAKNIVPVHLAWYEELYAWFREINHTEGMNKALKAKERLLGILKRENKVVVNKKTTINITKTASYDLGKLTDPQKARLQELINKMK